MEDHHRGPIRSNNEFDGEEYDARREQDGWTQGGFDDSTWEHAHLVAAPGGMLTAQMLEPMRGDRGRAGGYHQSQARRISRGLWPESLRDGAAESHGPRAHACKCALRLPKKADGTIKMEDNRSARLDGHLYSARPGRGGLGASLSRSGDALCRGHRFPGRSPPARTSNCWWCTRTWNESGEFACSNELLNRIYANVLRGTRMQERSVPLDPDRDERQAWLGHPAKTSESEGHLFNVAAF